MIQKLIDNLGLTRALRAINAKKADLKHPHVTSVIPDLPVGAITKAAWIDDIVTDYWGNVWLKCDGREIDIEMYPELAGATAISYIEAPSDDALVTPIMTGVTTNGFTASESRYADTMTRAWYAFTRVRSVTTSNTPPYYQWASSVNSYPGAVGNDWIQMELPVGNSISSYGISSCRRNAGSNLLTGSSFGSPVDWIIEGSFDGANFEVIDSQTDQNFTAHAQRFIYSLAEESKPFKFYRLTITKIKSTSTQLTISELGLFRKPIYFLKNIPPVDDLNSYIKATDHRMYPNYPIGWLKVLACNDPIVYAHDGEWLRCDGREIDIEEYPELAGSTTLDCFTGDVIITPAMNGNEMNGYKASMPPGMPLHTPTYQPWKAFDQVAGLNDEHDCWSTPNSCFTNYVANKDVWLVIELPEKKSIDKYIIHRRGVNTNVKYSFNPSQWTLEGSLDGNTWDVIDSQTGQSFPLTAYASKQYMLPERKMYKFYKLNITKTEAIGDSNCVCIGDLKLIYVKSEPSLENVPLVNGKYTYVKANHKGFKYEVE